MAITFIELHSLYLSELRDIAQWLRLPAKGYHIGTMHTKTQVIIAIWSDLDGGHDSDDDTISFIAQAV